MNLDKQRICVLGGGGFLGSHLVEALLARPCAEVLVLDRALSKLEKRARLKTWQVSISDLDALRRAVRTCDVVVSMTALCNPSLYNTRPREVIEANFTELVPLVDLCTAQRKWLVHLSTCEVYGLSALPQDSGEAALMSEDQTPLVLGPIAKERWTYACAKQLLERLLWAQGRHHGLPCTIIRPFNVIGPRMDYLPGIDGEGIPRVLACFMGALLRLEPLQVVGDGKQRRSFIHVSDFTEALVRVLENPEACEGEILNIGNPDNDISIEELARSMVRIYSEGFGGDQLLPIQQVSEEAFYGPGYEDTRRRVPDIQKIQRILAWQPSTTLEQMLPSIMEDYVARYGARLVGPAPRSCPPEGDGP